MFKKIPNLQPTQYVPEQYMWPKLENLKKKNFKIILFEHVTFLHLCGCNNLCVIVKNELKIYSFHHMIIKHLKCNHEWNYYYYYFFHVTMSTFLHVTKINKNLYIYHTQGSRARWVGFSILCIFYETLEIKS